MFNCLFCSWWEGAAIPVILVERGAEEGKGWQREEAADDPEPGPWEHDQGAEGEEDHLWGDH